MAIGSLTKDLEVRHCRLLLAVADTGGVAAAARTLGVAQSTVSEALLSLERLLGAPVTLRRPGQGATLTPVALALVPHARALVSASEAALAAVAPHGRCAIRLGAVESISSFLLPGPLRAFRQQWPQVDVRIAIGLCEDLRGRVGRSELDAALTVEGVEGDDDAALSPTQLRLVVAPDHPLAAGVVTRGDLADSTLLLTDHEGAFNALLKSWLARAGRQGRLQSAGSVDGVKRGVLNSNAVGVLPDYAVAEEIAASSLRVLTLDDPPPPVALRLTTSKLPDAGSALGDLVEKIRSALAPAQAMGGHR